jgi:hypothetical protein
VSFRIALLGIFALPVFAASSGKILSECDEAAEVRATVAQDAALEIRSSVSGGTPCYSVTAMVDGKKVQGYVTDPGLNAVVAFEKARFDSLRAAMSAPPVQPVPPPPPAPAPTVAAPAPQAPAAPPAAPPAPSKPAKDLRQ